MPDPSAETYIGTMARSLDESASRKQRRGPRASYEARREEIIDLAASLFAKNGFAATGVAEISDAVGLGKGGLYYYIGSKDALLVEIHDRVMEPLLERAHRIAETDTSPLVRLRLISEVLLGIIAERLDHVWVFLHEHRSLQDDLLERFRGRRREFEDIVTGLLEQGVAEGTFATDDTRITTLAFLGMHNMTYQWYRPEGRMSPRDLSAQYCRIFFGGIGGTVDSTDGDVARLRHIIQD